MRDHELYATILGLQAPRPESQSLRHRTRAGPEVELAATLGHTVS